MKKNIVRIALIQSKTNPSFADNFSADVSKIKIAARKGAQVVCLQELFAFPYFPQTKSRRFFSYSDSRYEELIREIFSKLSRDLGVVIIAPFFEKSKQGKYFNSVLVIDADGKALGIYRKMHIPYDPGFYEKYYFKPGDSGFKVFKTQYGTIGVLICWDQWFPEAARAVALKGAKIIFYPTAIGWDVRRRDQELGKERSAWIAIQRSHAIANGTYVASVNRTGKEVNLKFWGSSFVADPFGKIIASVGKSREQILFADCNLSEIKKTRTAWPFFRDLRIDAY